MWFFGRRSTRCWKRGQYQRSCSLFQVFIPHFSGTQKRWRSQAGSQSKPLNKFIRVTKFKMCTPQKIIQTLHKGDWLASLDLKDAYFHVPIRNQHRPYLRFAFQDRIFQFNVLPFGISTAPRVFTKVLAPLVGFLHHKGIRLFPYLDDCLIVARAAPQLLHSINLGIETLA